MRFEEVLKKCEGFQWDAGNRLKSWIKHGIYQKEAEDVFTRQPILVIPDAAHSQKERRYRALGMTSQGKPLYIFFTIRKNLIRVISSRKMHRKERKTYEEFKTDS